MGIIFDGKEFAKKVMESISDKVKGKKIVSIYNPDHLASRVYTNIKAKKAEELGVVFEKIQITNLTNSQIKSIIQNLNSDKAVDGIMIQMPLGTGNDQELIDLIDLGKDIDGLRPESGVMPATVRAVIEILNSKFQHPNKSPHFAKSFVRGRQILNSKYKICVVGNQGLVGSRIQKELGCEGMDKEDFDPTSPRLRGASVIISATGVASLINGQMVKEGVICIDVGYPKGDFHPDVASKASFFTPVPGGVGPVTVAMLFANLADLKNNHQ